MIAIWPVVREHMEKAQSVPAQIYNRGAQPREFQVGDRVLVLIPTAENKFLATWNGPYEVIEKLGPVNYSVRQPATGQTETSTDLPLEPIEEVAREDGLGRVMVRTQDANVTSGGREQRGP